MEALSEAAFGVKVAPNAYTVLLARVAAYPAEHGKAHENDASKSYGALAATKLPADAVQCSLALRTTICKLEGHDRYIDALNQLQQSLTPEAQQDPTVVGINEHLSVFSGYSQIPRDNVLVFTDVWKHVPTMPMSRISWLNASTDAKRKSAPEASIVGPPRNSSRRRRASPAHASLALSDH